MTDQSDDEIDAQWRDTTEKLGKLANLIFGAVDDHAHPRYAELGLIPDMGPATIAAAILLAVEAVNRQLVELAFVGRVTQ